MSNRPGRRQPGLRDRFAQQEERQHRRTVAWQVVVAVVVGLGVLAGVVAWVVLGRDEGAEAVAHPAVSTELGCASCHSTDGARSEGPTWEGLAGSERTLADGTTVVANEAYLRRAITDPGAEVVEGFGPSMPSIEVTDEQLDELVAFIESLGDPG